VGFRLPALLTKEDVPAVAVVHEALGATFVHAHLAVLVIATKGVKANFGFRGRLGEIGAERSIRLHRHASMVIEKEEGRFKHVTVSHVFCGSAHLAVAHIPGTVMEKVAFREFIGGNAAPVRGEIIVVAELFLQFGGNFLVFLVMGFKTVDLIHIRCPSFR